jgi:hypothetical protein
MQANLFVDSPVLLNLKLPVISFDCSGFGMKEEGRKIEKLFIFCIKAIAGDSKTLG